MLRHGLSLLAAAFETADHEELVALVRDGILSVKGPHGGGSSYSWIEWAVQPVNQDMRRKRWYSEHDAAQDRREKTPFDGDDPDRPPLAWVTFWNGEASNCFGAYVCETFRRWGFVMWDGPRLRASGALEYMALQSGWLHCMGSDPRAYYYPMGPGGSETETDES
jgi:hypothetical protein